ncbi:MAG: hypothetical protein WC730_00040 [Patescibacteria group bacterium]|jgi:transcriptional regulator of heat shock response
MNDRQATILCAIIDAYVKTAEPVSSNFLIDHYDLPVSSATVRNEMMALEDAGYVRQPHTSAGRVPTEEGYRFYLQHRKQGKVIGKEASFEQTFEHHAKNEKDLMREIAKVLVELSGETAVTALESDWHHTAGLQKLFDKPDFADVENMRSLSEVVDRMDEVMADVFSDVSEEMNVWIGRENPFGNQMATIMVRYRLPNGMLGMMGLVGPLRMDYERNMNLLEEARKIIEDDYGKTKKE